MGPYLCFSYAIVAGDWDDDDAEAGWSCQHSKLLNWRTQWSPLASQPNKGQNQSEKSK